MFVPPTHYLLVLTWTRKHEKPPVRVVSGRGGGGQALGAARARVVDVSAGRLDARGREDGGERGIARVSPIFIKRSPLNRWPSLITSFETKKKRFAFLIKSNK